MYRPKLLCAAAALVLSLACGSDDGASPDSGANGIGTEGGTLVSASGKGALIVPPGALVANAPLSISDVTESLPGDSALLSGAFELGPSGQTFDRPVTLSIALPDEAPDRASVIVTLNETTDTWEELPGSMVIGGRVYAQTTHFSFYGISIPEALLAECYELQVNTLPSDVHPLMVPGSIVVSDATRIGSPDTSFSRANPIELGTSWLASKRLVRIIGNAGMAGQAAWIDWSEQSGDAFTVNPDGSFEILIDLHVHGPYLGLTDVCQAATANETQGWLYGINIFCDQECFDDVPPDPAAALSALSLSSTSMLQPSFSPSTLSYQVAVPFQESTIRIRATAEQADANIIINGISVASGEESGDIALALGTTQIDVEVTATNGDARIYQLDVSRGAATFAQTAYLKASNTDAGDAMGKAIALAGDTLVVGAATEDGNGTGTTGDGNDNSTLAAGAVYVFRKTGGVWAQEAYLKASNTEPSSTSIFGASFGKSVALSSDGNRLIVGSPGEQSAVIGDQANNAAINAGAAYVFSRVGTSWSQEAYLKASNIDSADQFGDKVAMAGDGATVAITASGEDSPATGINGGQGNGSDKSGAVYVFSRSGTIWTQQAYVKPSTNTADDGFGFDLALSANGSLLAASSVREDGSATGIDGTVDEAATNSGAVFLFSRSGSTWMQEAYVKASNTQASDLFGGHLDLSSDGLTLVVAAVGEDSDSIGPGATQNDNSDSSGAVYVFEKNTNIWSETQFIKASNTAANDQFGIDVSLSGNRLIVGAHGEDSNATGIGGNQNDESASDSGAAYVFTKSGNNWVQDFYIKASNSQQGDGFGLAVAVSGSTFVVSTSNEDSLATGVNGSQGDGATTSGAAYVFE